MICFWNENAIIIAQDGQYIHFELFLKGKVEVMTFPSETSQNLKLCIFSVANFTNFI